jgi:hypothetical protein
MRCRQRISPGRALSQRRNDRNEATSLDARECGSAERLRHLQPRWQAQDADHRPAHFGAGQRSGGRDRSGLAGVAISLPAAETNLSWAQPGGSAAKSLGHLALGPATGQAWGANIGQGSSSRARLAAAPIIAGGRIYTIDSLANLRAFDARTGAQVWGVGVGRVEDRSGGSMAIPLVGGGSDGSRGLLFGGGLAFDNGRIYATNGVGDVQAFDAATGRPLWLVRPGGPLRGSPTVANDNLYVTSQDNQLYALTRPMAPCAGRHRARSRRQACSARQRRPPLRGRSWLVSPRAN